MGSLSTSKEFYKFGTSLSLYPDVNNDGVFDVLVGAPGVLRNLEPLEANVFLVHMEHVPRRGGSNTRYMSDPYLELGTVHGTRGITSLDLASWDGSEGCGLDVAVIGDIDGNGTPDYATVCSGGSGPWVVLLEVCECCVQTPQRVMISAELHSLRCFVTGACQYQFHT